MKLEGNWPKLGPKIWLLRLSWRKYFETEWSNPSGDYSANLVKLDEEG